MANSDIERTPAVAGTGVTIFRFKDIEPMPITGDEPFWITKTPVMAEGFRNLVQTGWAEGIEARVLLDVPGCNITFGRLKPGFTVPLHHHHGQGVYFVTAGTAFYGNVELKAGDGLLQPAYSAYTLKAGEEGLEIIEIRTVGGAETMFLSNSKKYWENMVEQAVKARQAWSEGWPDDFGASVKSRSPVPA